MKSGIKRAKTVFALALIFSMWSTAPGWSFQLRNKVGPHYQKPQVAAPANWGQTLHAQISMTDPLITWWQSFNDPLLNKLVEDAVHHNYDVQNAVARVREARALESAAVGRLFPVISARNEFSRTRFSDNGINPLGRFAEIASRPTPPGTPKPFNLGITNPTNDFKSGFDATWEIDVFGYRRWQLQATRDRIQAAEENRRKTIITVIADVARHYVELREAQIRMGILQKNIDLQQQSLNLTNERYRIGLAPRQDTTQAATQLETLRAGLPGFQELIETSAHALSLLTGREPNTLLAALSVTQPVPVAQPVVGLGLPASLILRRPDIRQAERELAAINADVASFRAQLYPVVRFTGNWGWEAINIEDLYKWKSRYWTINPNVNWTVFGRRELRQNARAAQARYTQQETVFRQTILTALDDVQDAVSSLDATYRQRDSLSAAVAQNEQTVQLTTSLYQTGLNNYLSVLDAQRSLVNLQDQLAQSQAETTLRTIRLYKALGGGWQAF
jgi:multidrug efflux system outer membrane protein